MYSIAAADVDGDGDLDDDVLLGVAGSPSRVQLLNAGDGNFPPRFLRFVRQPFLAPALRVFILAARAPFVQVTARASRARCVTAASVPTTAFESCALMCLVCGLHF